MSQYQSQNENKPQDDSWLEEVEENLEDHVPISEPLEDRINYQLDELQNSKEKKNQAKKIGVFAVVGTTIFCITAIGIGVFSNSSHTYISNNDTHGDVSGEVFIFEDNNSFQLDGMTYSLPLKVTDLSENGWTMILDDDETVTSVSGYESVYVHFYKDKKEFSASLKSFSKEEVSLENADVYSITFDEYRAPNVTCPLGLQIGMTEEEAKDIIEGSGYEYSYSEYHYSSSDSYYYYFNDVEGDEYYYSYDVDIYSGVVSNLNLYYTEY